MHTIIALERLARGLALARAGRTGPSDTRCRPVRTHYTALRALSRQAGSAHSALDDIQTRRRIAEMWRSRCARRCAPPTTHSVTHTRMHYQRRRRQTLANKLPRSSMSPAPGSLAGRRPRAPARAPPPRPHTTRALSCASDPWRPCKVRSGLPPSSVRGARRRSRPRPRGSTSCRPSWAAAPPPRTRPRRHRRRRPRRRRRGRGPRRAPGSPCAWPGRRSCPCPPRSAS